MYLEAYEPMNDFASVPAPTQESETVVNSVVKPPQNRIEDALIPQPILKKTSKSKPEKKVVVDLPPSLCDMFSDERVLVVIALVILYLLFTAK